MPSVLPAKGTLCWQRLLLLLRLIRCAAAAAAAANLSPAAAVVSAIDGAIAAAVAAVQRLGLRRCLMSTLPASLCHLSKLEHLDVSHNFLVDLPEGLWLMRSLQELLAQGNTFPKIPEVRWATLCLLSSLFDHSCEPLLCSACLLLLLRPTLRGQGQLPASRGRHATPGRAGHTDTNSYTVLLARLPASGAGQAALTGGC